MRIKQFKVEGKRFALFSEEREIYALDPAEGRDYPVPDEDVVWMTMTEGVEVTDLTKEGLDEMFAEYGKRIHDCGVALREYLYDTESWETEDLLKEIGWCEDEPWKWPERFIIGLPKGENVWRVKMKLVPLLRLILQSSFAMEWTLGSIPTDHGVTFGGAIMIEKGKPSIVLHCDFPADVWVHNDKISWL